MWKGHEIVWWKKHFKNIWLRSYLNKCVGSEVCTAMTMNSMLAWIALPYRWKVSHSRNQQKQVASWASTVKLEAIRSSKTFGSLQTTLCYNTEDNGLHKKTIWQPCELIFIILSDGNNWRHVDERVKYGMETDHNNIYILCMEYFLWIKNYKHGDEVNFWVMPDSFLY
jgi:hypothetical protein